MAQLDQLSAQLDRLASLDSGPFPVVSLYLNLQANAVGRDEFEPFLRKELTDRVHTYPTTGPERRSLEQDAEKIRAYLANVDRSLNGLALFASSGADLFEAVPLAAPVDTHRLFISDQPHLYPLARILDEYPRYVALLADTHSARVFVFAVNTLERQRQIESTKAKHHKKGGWSQARFQRHVENYHLQHAKDIANAVARIVREEAIDKVILAGDEVIVPLLRDQLPKEVIEKIIDVVKLDIRAPEREVLDATLAALREKDAETDRERVDELINAYRANGLACAGVEQTRRAFELGQVDELVIAAAPATIGKVSGGGEVSAPDRTPAERAADEFVSQARHTGARIRVIEDAALLAPIGGVGAFLRFKL